MRTRLFVAAIVVSATVAACGGGSTILSAGGSTAVDGVGVSGHWIVDVYDADGSLDQHHDFHNALEPTGGVHLASLLAGGSAIKRWEVWLDETSPFSNPACSGGLERCYIVQGDGTEDSATSRNLVVEIVNGAGSGLPDTLRLSGSKIADADGSIGEVATNLLECDASDATCATTLDSLFTKKVFLDPSTGANAPISVSAGQLIQVEVLISFGTLP